MKSNIPTRQTASFGTRFFVYPDPKVGPAVTPRTSAWSSPTSSRCSTCRSSTAGRGTRRADAKPEQVIVIDHDTNEKLFGGANSVGRTRADRTTAATKSSACSRRGAGSSVYYDMTQGGIGQQPEQIYMPFNFTPVLELRPSATATAGRVRTAIGYAAFLNSEAVWLQFWVELPTPEKQRGLSRLRQRLRPRPEEARTLPAAAAHRGDRPCRS